MWSAEGQTNVFTALAYWVVNEAMVSRAGKEFKETENSFVDFVSKKDGLRTLL